MTDIKHYLDNAATERVLTEAADAAYNAMLNIYGNPSSLHREGILAAGLLKSARSETAAALGCQPSEVYFTSGGTESINTALFGAASKHKSKFYHIVSTSIEHDASLNALKKLAASGFWVDFVPPDKNGNVSAGAILSAVREDTLLVSVMGVNNETGAQLPIRQIADGLKKINSRAIFHADMVQAFCKTERAAAQCGADIVSVSGHKIGAPKGIGAIYIKSGLTLPPLLLGGGQESGFRSGTENIPAIAAFGQACRVRRENFDKDFARISGLNEYARQKIAALLPECIFISGAGAAPHILSLSLPASKSEVMLRILSDNGVYVSAGSACAKGKRSHVLTQMKLPSRIIDGALRVSFCPENSAEDIDALAAALVSAYSMFS